MKETKRASRVQVMCLMAAMSVAAGDVRATEGYLLELLSWCAYDDRGRSTVLAARA